MKKLETSRKIKHPNTGRIHQKKIDKSKRVIDFLFKRKTRYEHINEILIPCANNKSEFKRPTFLNYCKNTINNNIAGMNGIVVFCDSSGHIAEHHALGTMLRYNKISFLYVGNDNTGRLPII